VGVESGAASERVSPGVEKHRERVRQRRSKTCSARRFRIVLLGRHRETALLAGDLE
jgi:hypothetical protein